MSFKVILGIDMETDIGSFSTFYNGVQNGTPRLLSIFEKRGIKATFFFTGDSAVKNENIVKMVVDGGHEIGCHSLYHEVLGDALMPLPDLKPLLPEEVELRIRVATEWVRKISGVNPLSFRCPRLWSSTAVINILEKLSYMIDASYPMFFYRKQYTPYHPSIENWLEKGGMKILEIPNFADMLKESNDPFLERDRDPWQIYRTEGAEFTMKYVDNFLEFSRQQTFEPVLCFYLHPWEFEEMPEFIDYGEAKLMLEKFLYKGTGQKACTELNKLIGLLTEAGGEFHKAIDMVKFY